MIYASGVVTFFTNNTNQNSVLKNKNENITLEVIEPFLSVDSNQTTGKIRCKFTAILPTSYECRSLEDYTGKVKPFLQASIKNIISSVEISHLNYVSAKVIQTFNKE